MTECTVVLEGGFPWGFRIIGGVDTGQELQVSRVNRSGKAVSKGIAEGDFITSINDCITTNLTNAEAHALLRKSGNLMKLSFKRKSSSRVSKTKQSDIKTIESFENYNTCSSSQNDTQKKQTNLCEQINENSTLSSDRTSSLSDTSTAPGNIYKYCSPSRTFQIAIAKANEQNLTSSSSSTSSNFSADNNNRLIDNVMARKRRRKPRFNNNGNHQSDSVNVPQEEEENTTTNNFCDNNIQSEQRCDVNETNCELPTDSVVISIAVEPPPETEKNLDNYKVEFPEVPRRSPKQRSPGITKSKSLDNDDVPKITELSDGTSEFEDKHQQSENFTIADVDSEVEWESSDDLQDIPVKPSKEFLSTVSIQIEEDLGFAETSRISPEDEKNLRDFLGGLNLVNSSEEASQNVLEKENYKERKAKKRLAIVQHFTQPKFLDVIHEENSDVSDKECKGSGSNKEPEKGPILLETKVTYPDVVGAEIVNTSVAESSSDAELVFLDESNSDNSGDDESEVKPSKINPLLSQLTPPPTPDVTPKEALLLNENNKSVVDENSEIIRSNSLSPSTCSDASSRAASQCTAKYNPSSSVGDVATLLNDEVTNETNFQPQLLRELCLTTLLSLPFGTDVIEELASVAQEIQNMAAPDSSKLNGPSSFKFKRVRPFLQKLNNSKEDTDEMDDNTKWIGMATESDPNVLVCLSPTQKEYLDSTKKIPQEGDKLLDMHRKFLNRCRSYKENFDNKTSSCGQNVITSVQLSGHRTALDAGIEADSNEHKMTNRLLAIIRGSDKRQTNVTDLENYGESRPTYENEGEPAKIAKKNSMQPRRPKSAIIDNTDPEGRRLKAKNLSEWLQLVRDKSSSETGLDKIMEDDNPHQIQYRNSSKDQMGVQKGGKRRLSLPYDIYQRQIDYIKEKEIELQREIEQLEEEKRKLFVEMIKNDDPNPPEPPVRRSGAKDRPKSIPMAPTEVFRQQMYEEYMSKVAARKDRKHNKVIKISSPPDDLKEEEKGNSVEVLHVPGIEEEFMSKLKQKHQKYGIKREDSDDRGGDYFSDQETDSEPVLVLNKDSLSTAKGLPKHLKEFVSITKHAEESGEETDTSGGIWAPGKRTSPIRTEDIRTSNESQSNEPPPKPIWTPRSAGSSPTVERKEFRPVSFDSPVLGRKQRSFDEQKDSIEPPWKASPNLSSPASFDNKITKSFSTDFSTSRLPRYQNPTITLLQKAREGQIPKGPTYITADEPPLRRPKDDKPPLVKPGEILYQIKNEYTSESEGEGPKKMADLSPIKYDGIGPTTKEGIPITLRSEVKDGNQHKWYKRMYDTIHKQKDKDEYVTVRYKQNRARYPYSSGYFSEPEPSAYDSDAGDRRSNLNRRRYLYFNEPKENGTIPPPPPAPAPSTPVRHVTSSASKSPSSVIRHGQGVYKNQPGKIENYVPGKSSISEKEAKQWWDEVMEIFDGHLEQQKHIPTKGHLSRAFKDSGYDSDSTLVFRRKNDTINHLSPKEQREAYKTIQKGGDIPLHGLRKLAPERPKEIIDLEYIPLTSTLTKIRIHKNPKSNRYFTYPANVSSRTTSSPLFAAYKRTAPSAISLKSLKPNSPPSPPKRRSSRNSSTLRLISTMTVKSKKSPISKRHETCFKSNDNVKNLKEKITCKLSPPSRRHEETQEKSKLKITKTLTLNPSGGSSKSIITSSSNKGKISENKNLRRSEDSLSRSLKTHERSSILQRKFYSSGQTFAEAKKNLSSVKLPSCSKLLKSTELLSPNEVKKAVRGKSSIGLSGIGSVSLQDLNRSKSTSCPSTPLQTRSSKLKSEDTCRKLNAMNKEDTRNSYISNKKLTNKKSKVTTKDNVKSKLDSKKDKQQKKVLNKTQHKTNTKEDYFMEKPQNISSSKLLTDEIKKQTGVIRTNDFFQHLFLKDLPREIGSMQKCSKEDVSWISEKVKMLQRKRTSFSEPSIGALMIYLKSVKPVTESKFKSLDTTYTRSRSTSPKTVTWKDDNLISYKIDNDRKERSISLPSKIPISRTSRSPSPCRTTSLNVYRPLSPSKMSPRPISKSVKHLTTLQSRPQPMQIYFSSEHSHSPVSSLSSLSIEKDGPQATITSWGQYSPKVPRKLTPKTVKELSASKKIPIRSRSAGDADESKVFNSNMFTPVLEKSVSFSELSEIGSLRQFDPPGRCNRFKELKNFYQTLEKFSEVKRVASSTDIRPRGKLESEIVDYRRWKEVHTKERAEKEMKLLYSKLKYDQLEKGFLFEPKTTSSWRKENDHGLRCKEKSIEDLRDELQRLSIKNERPLTSSELSLVKDLYKPLWRGSSVIDLATTMVKKRSHSEETTKNYFLPGLRSFGKTDFGFLRQIWSSLSTEQLDNLKSQLSEIYGKNGTSTLSQKTEPPKIDTDYIDVLHSKPNDTDLKIRRFSESTVSLSQIPQTERKIMSSRNFSENEKRNLSFSLCKEALERIDKNTSKNIILPKETRGSIVAPEITPVNLSEATSPRTCYSLEISEDETDRKTKDNDYLLVLTDRLPPRKSEEINNTLNTWAEPKRRNHSTETVGKSTSETESGSTDESTKTAIFVDKKDEVIKKIKYFEEKASEDEQYVSVIYKPAESDSDKSDSSSKTKEEHLPRSQSNQNLKEMFGEKLPNQKLPLPSEDLDRSSSQIMRKLNHEFGQHERSRSDPELNRKSQIHIPGQKIGDVDTLRRKYEYPWIERKSRSRIRRGGVVSPLFFRPEDRLMPHINIISKIASLCSKKDSSRNKHNMTSSMEELASYFGCPLGEVEKLRKKFDSPDREISILGRMFTSSPNVHELKDIAPYLVGDWTAHRYPRLDDNTRSLSSPEHSPAFRDTSIVRKDRSRPKSSSPPRSKEQKKFDPKTDPLSRYCPEETATTKRDSERYRSWYRRLLPNPTRPTVKFKGLDPEPPVAPPKRNLPGNVVTGSPRKYVENEVTIHYKTPVVQEIKDLLSEEELSRRQVAHMQQVYEEERRRKYLQQLQDMNSRRHTDNFVPSQKSPIPLNRYDDFPVEVPKVSPRPRSPEPRLVARALYNFVGQTARELTFRKGDLIYVKKQIDKNWYEGELNAMIGLFPSNYVEIVPYDGIKSTTKKPHEGQARAKYNFIAQTHLELSLAKGELVVVTRRVDDNWFEGRIGGRKGIFPVSYVEVLVEPGTPAPPAPSKPVGSPAAHTLLLNGTASGIESMGSHSYLPPVTQQFTSSYRAKPITITSNGYASLSRSSNSQSPYSEALHIDTQNEPSMYRSLYKYRPQNDDELELLEGDIVYVLEKCDDGWFVGSSQRTGNFGTFPGNYVEKVN